MSRGGSKLRGHHDVATSERVSWLDQFADSINEASKKTSVEVARYRSELSLHDQISSVVSRHPGHLSVDSLVQEYHERTGLSEYLKNSKSQEKSDKIASFDDLFDGLNKDLKDKIINFVKNKITTSHGQISVPAVQHDIISAFKSDGLQPYDIENDKVARFISGLIIEAQKQSPPSNSNTQNLGSGVGVVDVDSNDSNNTDFYKSLMPYMGQG